MLFQHALTSCVASFIYNRDWTGRISQLSSNTPDIKVILLVSISSKKKNENFQRLLFSCETSKRTFHARAYIIKTVNMRPTNN